MTQSTQLTERLRTRLRELESEFATGQRMLEEHEAQARTLRETLLRVTGAILVLREELAAADAAADGAASNGHAPRGEPLAVGEQSDGG